MQCAMPLVRGHFVLLTVFTTANIVLNTWNHFKTVVVSFHHYNAFFHTHIASHFSVMLGFQYLHTEARIIVDPDFAGTERYSIFVSN